MFTVYHINVHHVYNKLLSSLLKTVFEFIKNDKIGNSSFLTHLSQQKGCKLHKVCSPWPISETLSSSSS